MHADWDPKDLNPLPVQVSLFVSKFLQLVTISTCWTFKLIMMFQGMAFLLLASAMRNPSIISLNSSLGRSHSLALTSCTKPSAKLQYAEDLSERNTTSQDSFQCFPILTDKKTKF